MKGRGNVKISLAGLSAAVNDPAAAQVVGRDFHFNEVAGDDADEILAHLPGHVGDDLVPIGQFHAKLGVGEGLFNLALVFVDFFFRHRSTSWTAAIQEPKLKSTCLARSMQSGPGR